MFELFSAIARGLARVLARSAVRRTVHLGLALAIVAASLPLTILLDQMWPGLQAQAPFDGGVSIASAASSGPPAAREAHSAVWDSQNNQMLVFGGYSSGTLLNDLWSYKPANNIWTQLAPSGGPPAARYYHSAVWDSQNNQMLVFGGYTPSSLNDLWSYKPSTNTWTQLTPAAPPSARNAHKAVWDSLNNQMLVFAGHNGTAYLNDLWSYKPSANTWTKLTPAAGPPPVRQVHGQAWDSTANRMLVFGGDSTSTTKLNDLWSYKPANPTDPTDTTANAWTQLTPAGGPPTARGYMNTAWDATNSQMLVFGGSTTSGNCCSGIVGDLWSYSAAANLWTQLTTATTAPARRSHSAVWDPTSNQMLVFGGVNVNNNLQINDLWAFRPATTVWANLTLLPLTLSPDTGGPGSSLSLSSTGWTQVEQVTFTFDGNPLATVPSPVATVSGAFSNILVTVPAGTTAGAHIIQAAGASSGQMARATLNVAATSISLSPSRAGTGARLAVSGSGFTAGDTITLRFDGTLVTTDPSNPVADSAGNVAARFIVPTVSLNTSHTVSVTGAPSGKAASAALVVPNAVLRVNPIDAGPGTSVELTGDNLGASQPVTFTFDGVNLPTSPSTVTSDTTGDFSRVRALIPAGAAAGPHTIVASSATASASFTVDVGATFIKLDRSEGGTGLPVTVLGAGFPAGDTIAVRFDSTVMATTTNTVVVAGDGAFSGKFAIPAVNPDTGHTVSVTGTPSGKAASAFFRAPPTFLTVNPTEAGAGTSVEVTGKGFEAHQTITFTFDGASATPTPNPVIADASGNFSRALLTVPPGTATGTRAIAATGAAATASFPVEVVTTFIKLDRPEGGANLPVNVTGAGFPAGDTVTLRFDGTVQTTLPSPSVVAADGSFSSKYFTPAVSLNTSHTVSATGSPSGRVASAFFRTPGTFIYLDPQSGGAGEPGTSVRVFGTGFAANETVTFKFDNNPLTTSPSTVVATICCSYNFDNVLFTVPAGTAAGAHTVTATGTSSRTASFPFEVMANFITLTPNEGGAGTVIVVTGKGMAAGDAVNIRFDGTIQSTVPDVVTADGTGMFTATITAPTVSLNTPHTVSATGSPSSKTASAFFRVPPTVINLSPPQGGIGTSIGVSGNGFAANEVITFTLDGAPLTTVGGVTTDASGNFARAIYLVPSGTGVGPHTIRATGTTSGNVGRFTFQAVSTFITIDPLDGDDYTEISVSGAGFNANEAVTVRFDGVVRLTATVDNAGGFFARFTVGCCPAPNQSHNVTATGGTSGKSASAFWLTAPVTLSLNPQRGGPGTGVLMHGDGFNYNETITFTFDNVTVATITGPVAPTGCCYYSFSGEVFVVPAGAAAGPHLVEATGASSLKKSRATFTVEQPAIAITPPSSGSGTTITVAGTGFSASQTIAIKFDDNPVPTVPAAVTTDSSGNFSGVFGVPSVGANTVHTVIAADNAGKTTRTYFFATTAAVRTVTVTPSNGPPGTTATVRGSGFSAADTTVTVNFGGTAVTTSPNPLTVSGGAFEGTFVVPGTTSNGNVTVTATGQPGNDSASANFRVVRLSAAPTSGGPGTSVELATFAPFGGCNFDNGETISFMFDGNPITTIPATVTADSCGNFSRALFFVPAGTAAGAHTLKATGASSGVTASAGFTVTAHSITVTPATGGDDQPVTVNGAGFTASETVAIRFNTTVIKTATASDTGTFTTTFRVPDVSLNTAHTVSATGSLSSKVAEARFVVPGANLRTLGTFSGGAGTPVGLEGFGFTSGETVTFTFDGAALTTTPDPVKADVCCYGFRNVLFTIPVGAAAGAHTIEARGASSGVRASFPVDVVSNFITLNPARGGSAFPIALNGQGFSPNESVTLRFNSSILANFTANGSGAVTGTFRVPSVSVNSAHTVTVTGDVSGKSASAFFVAPGHWINTQPVAGGPGTSVQVDGTGFGANEVITFSFVQGVTVDSLVTEPVAVTTNSGGNFGAWVSRPALFKVPAGKTPGTYLVRATGAATGRVADFPFEVATTFITLDPIRGSDAQPVTVTGAGFGPNDEVSLRFDSTDVVTATASSGGAFTATFRVPSVSLNTFHTVSVTGSPSGRSASAGFTVPGTDLRTLGTFSGGAGTPVGLEGSGFTSNETMTFTLDGAPLTTVPGSVKADVCCYGFRNVLFLIPAGTAAGTHIVEARGASSGARASFPVQVVSNFITIDPPVGGDSLPVTVAGQGFGPGSESVTVKFDTTVVASFITDSAGAFTGTVRVPNVSLNTAHTVTVTGDVSGKSASAYFLTPETFFDLSPVSGGPGTSVGLAGTGFGASETVTFTFDGTALPTEPATVTVDSAGNFGRVFLFRVPAGKAVGRHTVRATGAATGRVADFLFDIEATSLNIGPMRGSESLPVTVNGIGFQAGETVSLRFDGSGVLTTPVAVTVQADGTFAARFTTCSNHCFNPNTFHTVSATGNASGKTASAAFAAPGTALVLSPTSAPEGATVTIVESVYWSSNEGITFTLDGQPLVTTPASVIANSCCPHGGWGPPSVTFTVPVGTAPGSHKLEARGSLGNLATFDFLVTPTGVTRSIALNPPSGPAGAAVNLTGVNFSLTDTAATTTFDGVTVATSPSTVPVVDGGLAASFTVPASAEPGNHTVCVTGNPAGDRSCALYTVVAAFITLSPPSGPPGTLVTVNGGNFLPVDTSVALTFAGVTVLTSPNPIAVSVGSFSATFRIPSGAAGGSHTVRATGAPGNDPAHASFSVTQEGAPPTFIGKVALEAMGAAGDPRWGGYPLIVKVLPSGGTTPAATVPAGTDGAGLFAVVASVAAGNYDLEVKGQHTLSNKLLGVALPRAATAAPLNFGTLTTGDLSNDNAILGGDYSILVTNFGRSGPQVVTAAQSLLQGQSGSRHGESPSETGGTPAEGGVHLALRPASDTLKVGQVVRVEVIASAAQSGVDSVDLFLEFNPAVLQVVDEYGAAATSVATGGALPVILRSSVDQERGRIAVSAGRAPLGTPPTGSFTVATLYFKALAASPEAGLAISLSGDAPTAVHFRGQSVLGSVSDDPLRVVQEGDVAGSGLSEQVRGPQAVDGASSSSGVPVDGGPQPAAGLAADLPRRNDVLVELALLEESGHRAGDVGLNGLSAYVSRVWQKLAALLRA